MKRARKWTTVTTNDHEVPDKPGVYAVYVSGVVVYVGCSSILRQRVTLGGLRPRFQFSQHGLKTPWCWGDGSIKYCVTRRYGEELMLEARLIRRLKPLYNERGIRHETDIHKRRSDFAMSLL